MATIPSPQQATAAYAEALTEEISSFLNGNGTRCPNVLVFAGRLYVHSESHDALAIVRQNILNSDWPVSAVEQVRPTRNARRDARTRLPIQPPRIPYLPVNSYYLWVPLNSSHH